LQRSITLLLSAVAATAAAGCSPSYSPNTYSTAAVQQVNKVEPAVVIGFRQVKISANGTVGAVTGGAAGGILGAQSPLANDNAALGAVAGSAIGSIVGTTLEHATGDTFGWEYIVRKDNGDLLSVTQHEETPLALGQKVLVIAGNQARIVPDYSVPVELPAQPGKKTAPAKETAKKPALKPVIPIVEPASPDPQPVVPVAGEGEAQPAPVAAGSVPAATPEAAVAQPAPTPAESPAVQPEPVVEAAPTEKPASTVEAAPTPPEPAAVEAAPR
jgi:outer membrane lipoprotein SlyB